MFGREFRGGSDVVAEVHRERLRAEMLKKAEGIIAEDQFLMQEFVDFYGRSAVVADMEKVKKLKDTFEARMTPADREQKRLATAFEGLLLDQIDQSMWFGEGVTTRAASEFDDLVNGVDILAVVDVQGQAQANTGLAIDVTFAGYPRKKIERILGSIQDGTATTVKYFNSKEVQGKLHQIPRVVLAAEAKNVEALGEIWLKEKQGLVHHPIILQLADQMFGQLEAYYLYARRVRGPQDQITDMYKRQYELWGGKFETLDVDALERHPNAPQFLQGDHAHATLMEFVEQVKKGTF